MSGGGKPPKDGLSRQERRVKGREARKQPNRINMALGGVIAVGIPLLAIAALVRRPRKRARDRDGSEPPPPTTDDRPTRAAGDAPTNAAVASGNNGGTGAVSVVTLADGDGDDPDLVNEYDAGAAMGPVDQTTSGASVGGVFPLIALILNTR